MKKTTSLRLQDPFLAREKQRYSHPLPSREWIITLLERRQVPVKIAKLREILDISDEESSFFERRLHAMARDGQVLINRRGSVLAAEKLAIVRCRVQIHKNDFGFAIPETNDGAGDFVLYAAQMRGLMNGDIVTVRPIGTDRRGRREGQVLDIVERANKNVVGRLSREHGVDMLVPEDRRLGAGIVLQPDSVKHVKPGQVLVAAIESYPEANRPAVGRVIEVLGEYGGSGMEIEIAVRKHHLPHEFSAACQEAAAKVPDHVTAKDIKGRHDIRHLPLMTIDGETARDFDDAVYAEKVGRNFRLLVAIADVSHYVRPGEAIDTDAVDRATSAYFPRRVLPMLPENLSNGICSLNPDVDRLCMVCDMTVTYAGNVRSYEFYPAVMRSHARLTYTQAWDIISSDNQNDPLKERLNPLYALYQVLLKKRRQRGAVEFDSTETQMIFDADGKIERIVPVLRNDAHRLIEECMLAANVCAAEYLLKNKHPSLYRNHAGPTGDKLAVLREQLALLGLTLGGGDKPAPTDYAALAAAIENRTDKEVIQVMMLRSMQQAVYGSENIGHFGLAYSAYTHFTSPIRRYPDLTVHRAIKDVLNGTTDTAARLEELGVHCSRAERRADEASRDVENWLKTFYMKDKIGETFAGTVTGVTNFGLFVTLDGIYTEGLVHISDLGSDYFVYRPELMALQGEKTHRLYKLGDKMQVQVAAADPDAGKIDFLPVADESDKKRRSAAKAGNPAAAKPASTHEKKGKSHNTPIKTGEKKRSKPKVAITKKTPRRKGKATE